MTNRNIIVALFDDSANLFDDWIAYGYEVWCFDLMPLELRIDKPGVRHFVADLRLPLDLSMVDSARVALASAHPPCGNLAISGSRWFKGKGLRALSESISMFATAAEACEALGAPYMIENPMSTISTYWRKPDHRYSPYQFSGHAAEDYYTKETWLWTGNGFEMPAHCYDIERYARGVAQRKAAIKKHGKANATAAFQADQPDYPDSRIHAATGPLKAYFRSITPKGFGRAVFLANCPVAHMV